MQQLEKRVDVVRVFLYEDEEIVYRELALYKVPTEAILQAGDIEEILQHYSAKIIEINKSFAVISKVGTTGQTQQLYEVLGRYGVMQLQRSGRVAISRER